MNTHRPGFRGGLIYGVEGDDVVLRSGDGNQWHIIVRSPALDEHILVLGAHFHHGLGDRHGDGGLRERGDVAATESIALAHVRKVPDADWCWCAHGGERQKILRQKTEEKIGANLEFHHGAGGGGAKAVDEGGCALPRRRADGDVAGAGSQID